MDRPTDKDLKALALLLASHTDDLQLFAASLAEKMAAAYSDGLNIMRGMLIDAYLTLLDDRTPGTYAYMEGVKRLRKVISEFRKERFNSMMDILRSSLESLERNEEKFTLAWIAALYEAFSMTSPKTSELSKRAASEVRRYGVYNGGTVDEIFRKVMDIDIQRMVNTVTMEAALKSEGGISSLRNAIDRALLTTERQLRVNVTLAVNGVSNDTSVAIAKRNARYVDAVMWETELDERVCEDCDDLEGKVFDPKDAPSCPMHPNCRCRLVPIQREMVEYLKEEREEA